MGLDLFNDDTRPSGHISCPKDWIGNETIRVTIDVYSCFVWLYQENIEWLQMIFLCFVWLYHETFEWL